MTPALAALENPIGVPAAALRRLAETSAALRGEATGIYVALLVMSARMVERSGALLAEELADRATPEGAGALRNAERLAAACARLFEEVARRSVGRERAAAMRRARLYRNWRNDIALTRRAFSPDVAVGAAAVIRILPGAEPALDVLRMDPLAHASAWDPVALAGTLARWVIPE